MYENVLTIAAPSSHSPSKTRMFQNIFPGSVEDQKASSSATFTENDERPPTLRRTVEGARIASDRAVYYEIKNSQRRYQKKLQHGMRQDEAARLQQEGGRFAIARQKYMDQQRSSNLEPISQPDRSDYISRGSTTAGIFGRTIGGSSGTGNGIAVLLLSLTGIIFVFLLFWLLSRMCGTRQQSAGNNDHIRKGLAKFNEAAIHDYTPQSVLYPKRIYELQAEEGYFSQPPAFHYSQDSICSSNLLDPIINMIQITGKRDWLQSRLLRDTNNYDSVDANIAAPLRNAFQRGHQFVRKLTGAEFGIPQKNPEEKPECRDPHGYMNALNDYVDLG
ncbi:hypothetical protein Ddc_12048 [Ditylenchus destructor]|nr:hypothetical protein Ddc_12048 [Ditylenchus destructor]